MEVFMESHHWKPMVHILSSYGWTGTHIIGSVMSLSTNNQSDEVYKLVKLSKKRRQDVVHINNNGNFHEAM